MGDLISILLGLMILLVIFLIIVAASYYSKAEIIELFQVDNRTFQRWLDRWMPAYAYTWKTSRKISGLDYFRILEVLGDPSKFPTLNKAGIIAKLKDDQKLPVAAYRYLRQVLQIRTQEPELLGISKFPPKIAQRLFERAEEGLAY